MASARDFSRRVIRRGGPSPAAATLLVPVRSGETVELQRAAKTALHNRLEAGSVPRLQRQTAIRAFINLECLGPPLHSGAGREAGGSCKCRPPSPRRRKCRSGRRRRHAPVSECCAKRPGSLARMPDARNAKCQQTDSPLRTLCWLGPAVTPSDAPFQAAVGASSFGPPLLKVSFTFSVSVATA